MDGAGPAVAVGTIAVLCVLLAGVTWERRRASAVAMPLFVLCLAISLWNGSYALHLAGLPAPTPDFWVLLLYLGAVIIPPGVLVLAVRLSGRERWPGVGIVIALAVEPALVVAVLISNARYELLYDGERDPAIMPTAAGGAMYWVNVVYASVLVLIAIAIVANRIRTTHGVRRRQAIAVFVAIAVPFVVTLILSVRPGGTMDLTPPSMAVSVIAISIALFRYRILELGPVARHTLFDSMDDAAIAADVDGRITDLNPAAAAMFGVERRAVLGRRIEHALAQEEELLAVLATPSDEPAEASLAADPQRTIEARITTLTDRSGWPIGRLVLCRDITVRKDLERQLARLASIDPLTGVHNRRGLESDWVRELARWQRHGDPLSCVLLDLDDFKQLNDTGGHALGDRALMVFARTIEQQVRRIDSVARIGGDEFVVLMPATNAAAAAQVIRRVAADVEARLTEELQAGRVSVSAGVAEVSGPSLADALDSADEALYLAKQSGRGAIRVAGDEPVPHGGSG